MSPKRRQSDWLDFEWVLVFFWDWPLAAFWKVMDGFRNLGRLLMHDKWVMLMVPVHALLHIPVSSVSGQAVLTMPVMVPLSDLLGVSRQATVLAYQTGAGLTEFWTPTNGALMAILLSLRCPFNKWLRFAWPMIVAMTVLGVAGILIVM